MVCATCFDDGITHDALDDHLPHIWELKRNGQYDEALACLVSILEANRFPDHNKWLSQSIASERGWILCDAGRYLESEQAYKDWAELGFQDLWRRQLHALGLARVLEALGRDAEVPAVLENVLGDEETKDLTLALTVLTELIRISEKLGVPFNPKWLPIAEALANEEGVEMPSATSPAAAILALEEVLRALPPEERMRRYRERAEAESG